MLLQVPFASLLAALLASQVVAAADIQATNITASPRRAEAVAKAFRQSYNAYKKYCFGRDELKPIAKGCDDFLGGWGATLVDVQSTAKIMGLDDIYEETVARSKETDYTKTGSDTISIFETNIRHVGGLLSSYELGGKTEKKLVEQAETVGQRLLHGWIGDNKLPYNTLTNWNTTLKPKTDDGAIIAETGTLIIEFDRLSKYSGNKTYLEYAEKAMKATIDAPGLPFPNLNPQGIDPKTNKPIGDYVTWGGGSDSFFEYEIKYGQLTGTKETYVPAWISAVKQSIKHLLTKASGTEKDLTYLGDYSKSNGGFIPRGSHLECFVGGNWMLGGKLLGNDQIFDYGLKLAQSCANTYISTPIGIGPEGFVYQAADGSTNNVHITDVDFYKKNGFNYAAVDYVLRPEVLESVFYAYRFTGDKWWQDVAWDAFKNIRKYCKTEIGAFTALSNVSTTDTGLIDDSESFLYAELLKYIYLTFTDGDTINLNSHVFNTEGHPFQIDDDSVSFADLMQTDGEVPAPTRTQGGSADTKVDTSKPTKTKPMVPPAYFSGNPFSAQSLDKVMSDFFGTSDDDSDKQKRGVDQAAFEAHQANKRATRRRLDDY